jgi:hypothetical protein
MKKKWGSCHPKATRCESLVFLKLWAPQNAELAQLIHSIEETIGSTGDVGFGKIVSWLRQIFFFIFNACVVPARAWDNSRHCRHHDQLWI